MLNEFIQNIASDQYRTVHLGYLDGLGDRLMNIGKFNSKKFKIGELSQVVKKKRNASQAGPNQVLCKIYRKCPRIMLTVVRDKVIPLNWHNFDEMMIPKVKNPRQSNLVDYRHIGLGNVEGTLFCSLIA